MARPDKPYTTEPAYSLDLALSICDQISEGRSLRKTLKDAGMPSVAKWFRWLGEHKDELSEHYTRAKQLRAQVRADDIIDIAEDRAIPIEDRKLICAMRQWEASKMDRANYGDRQQVEHSGKVELPAMDDREAATRLAALLREAQRQQQGG